MNKITQVLAIRGQTWEIANADAASVSRNASVSRSFRKGFHD